MSLPTSSYQWRQVCVVMAWFSGSALLSSDIIMRATVTIPKMIYELRALDKSIGIYNKMGINTIGSFCIV
jgi:hypothetical protein